MLPPPHTPLYPSYPTVVYALCAVATLCQPCANLVQYDLGRFRVFSIVGYGAITGRGGPLGRRLECE